MRRVRQCVVVAVAALLCVRVSAPAGSDADSPSRDSFNPDAKLPAEQLPGWETDCSTVIGWHWEEDSPGIGTKIEQFEPSVIKIKQTGKDTWGKAAYVVENIDLEQTPILEIKVNKVDLASAFSVAVAPRDWSEMLTVIPRTSADGVHTGDISKAVRQAKNRKAWEGPTTFNVVIVIEGKNKASYIDEVKIRADDGARHHRGDELVTAGSAPGKPI